MRKNNSLKKNNLNPNKNNQNQNNNIFIPLNNNLNNEEYIEDSNKMNEFKSSSNSLESSDIDVYDKNISLLKEKIKEQEKNIIYLNNRLENYDITMKEITNLNIELNALNEIIRNKNKTIQEFRNVSDLSKKKFEELLQNNDNLVQNINLLKEENKKLKNIYKNMTINNDSNLDNKIKEELKIIKIENEKLKKEINEKNEEITNLKQIINILKNKNMENQKEKDNSINKNNNISTDKIRSINSYKYEQTKVKKNLNKNKFIKKYHSLLNKKLILEGRYTPSNLNKNIVFKYHHNQRDNNNLFDKNFSTRTESNYGNYNTFDNFRKENKSKDNHSIYNCSIKNNHMEPFDYSNYLLDNLKENICKNYIK